MADKKAQVPVGSAKGVSTRPASEAPYENIFLFIPNLIGMRHDKDILD